MKSSVVNIESVSNNSFGTGFVIDSDEKGVFVLTCQHVLDDVEIPVVENVLAKVVAKGEFIDMAVLYVSKLHLEALTLQTASCDQLDVDVIGFSTFNKTLTQKKHINASLYEEPIELHSKEDDTYYNVHKIKAKDGFNFDRGNSGSPVICKQTGNVIAMVSNKEGSEIGYAIDIVNLKRVWEEVPQKLFITEIEQPVQEEPQEKETIEEVSGKKEEPQKIIEPLPPKKKSSLLRNLLLSILMIVLGSGSYIMYDQYQQEELRKKAKAAQWAKDKQAQADKEEQERKAEAEAKAEKEEQERQERERKERERKAKLEKALAYEKRGFDYIVKKDYNNAIISFKKADRYTPSFHHVREIASLLNRYKNSMNQLKTKRKVLSEIVNKYSKYAPRGFTTTIKRQLLLPIKVPSVTLPKTIEKPRVLNLQNIKPPKEDVK